MVGSGCFGLGVFHTREVSCTVPAPATFTTPDAISSPSVYSDLCTLVSVLPSLSLCAFPVCLFHTENRSALLH